MHRRSKVYGISKTMNVEITYHDILSDLALEWIHVSNEYPSMVQTIVEITKSIKTWKYVGRLVSGKKLSHTLKMERKK